MLQSFGCRTSEFVVMAKPKASSRVGHSALSTVFYFGSLGTARRMCRQLLDDGSHTIARVFTIDGLGRAIGDARMAREIRP